MFLSSEIRYTLNYFSESKLHFLNYLFMVKVKVTEAIDQLKMCHFFSYLRLRVLAYPTGISVNPTGARKCRLT